MKPDGRNIPVTVEAIYNEEGEAMESAPHAQQRIYVKLTEMPEVFDILHQPLLCIPYRKERSSKTPYSFS